MFFHLIGIKEKHGEKYDLDLLLQGGDEDFIRKFLGIRGVVIVSIEEYKEDPNTFGNISISINFSDNEILILTQGEDLNEKLYFIIFLGLAPLKANYINDPIPDDEVQKLIESNTLKIKEEDENIRKQNELAELKEQKKYEESGIKDGLKIINENIDHIQQVLKAGKGLLLGSEIKKLEDYLNEMKKIRLGTNFNKMVALVMDAHILLQEVEKNIMETYKSESFLIDDNSSVTNIDVLSEYYNYNRISEKAALQPSLMSTTEAISNIMKTNSIFLNLLWRDILYTYNNTNLEEAIDITLKLVEYIVLTTTVVISMVWLFGQLLGYNQFSLYLLPAIGRLGLLLYLFISLQLKGISTKLIGFLVLALIYRRGLVLLLNTFAMT